MDFVKFLRTPFFMEHLQWLLLAFILAIVERIETLIVEHLRWSFFAKIVNSFQLLTIFAKNSILDVRLAPLIPASIYLFKANNFLPLTFFTRKLYHRYLNVSVLETALAVSSTELSK